MRDTYRIDVAPILENLSDTIIISDDLALTSFCVGDEVFEPTSSIHFDVTLTNVGTALVAMGTASLPVTATCARCLTPFATEIAAEVDGFYVRPGHDEGIPEEQEIEYIDAENTVDILPAIMAALVLEAPFAPLHDEDCAGICPTCGADLNEGPCGCAASAEGLHPFAALEGLLEGTDSDGE
jgi:uncharacterized protein